MKKLLPIIMYIICICSLLKGKQSNELMPMTKEELLTIKPEELINHHLIQHTTRSSRTYTDFDLLLFVLSEKGEKFKKSIEQLEKYSRSPNCEDKPNFHFLENDIKRLKEILNSIDKAINTIIDQTTVPTILERDPDRPIGPLKIGKKAIAFNELSTNLKDLKKMVKYLSPIYSRQVCTEIQEIIATREAEIKKIIIAKDAEVQDILAKQNIAATSLERQVVQTK